MKIRNNNLRRRRIAESDVESRDRWLISYADLVTLLLALFVVLYAASDSERARQIAQTFSNENSQPILAGNGVLPGSNTLASEKSKIESILSQNPAFNQRAKIGQNEKGIVVSLAEAGVFAPGGAEINSEAAQLIDVLAVNLSNSDAIVRIEGHTDSTPISTARFPSNWELSTARAAAVLSRLIALGVKPSRLSAAGYGGEQPIADNSTIEGRAANRRVDIVILSH